MKRFIVGEDRPLQSIVDVSDAYSDEAGRGF